MSTVSVYDIKNAMLNICTLNFLFVLASLLLEVILL